MDLLSLDSSCSRQEQYHNVQRVYPQPRQTRDRFQNPLRTGAKPANTSGLTRALFIKGRICLVPCRYSGSSTTISPNVLCQWSFFTLFPCVTFFRDNIRGNNYLSCSSCLERLVSHLSHFFYKSHFSIDPHCL